MAIGEFDYSFKAKNPLRGVSPQQAPQSYFHPEQGNKKSRAMKEVWRKRKERERKAAKQAADANG